MDKKKVILDVDTGSDDAIAIILAVLHPDLDVLGITTVNVVGSVVVAAVLDAGERKNEQREAVEEG